jgi:hypothetical protein
MEPLNATESEERIVRRAGPMEEKRRSVVVDFLSRYWEPIPCMIEVALGLSLAVARWTDAVIMGALLAMNGVVSFWEEHQAGDALEALKQRLATTARVRRDGVWRQIEARDLVRGDVIHMRLGDTARQSPSDTPRSPSPIPPPRPDNGRESGRVPTSSRAAADDRNAKAVRSNGATLCAPRRLR